jgi:predicted RNA binding protein YcfA (HicA-like mRNA interferase family)
MGKHYPLLDREQVESILESLKFVSKRQSGSHCQWEGYTKGIRRIVTVDHLKKGRKEKYSHRLLLKMIQQSGLSKEEFYSHL